MSPSYPTAQREVWYADEDWGDDIFETDPQEDHEDSQHYLNVAEDIGEDSDSECSDVHVFATELSNIHE